MSDVLVARAREIDGISRPVTLSFAVHVGIVVTLAVLPATWFAHAPPDKPMTISLGAGAVGPDPNGQTALAGRKVEAVAPPTKRPDPIIPTSQRSTALTEPVKAPVKTPPKAAAKPSPPVTVTPTTKPAVGAQISEGNAVAATSATGLSAGLSSGGLGGIETDADFCCKEYLQTMLAAVNAVWQPNQGGAVGETVMEFVIEKNGAITGVKVSRSSGNPLLDLASQRALAIARFAPIPDRYPGQRMIILLKFPYTK